MRIYIVSGGPGTGKTSLIKELKNRGYNVLFETARHLAESDERFVGKSIKKINMYDFQHSIFKFQKEQFKNLKYKRERPIFSDRGLGDTLAFMELNNIYIPEKYLTFSKRFNHLPVFMLEPLGFYEKDELRQESENEQKEIHKQIIKVYEDLGHVILPVSIMPIKERADFIIENIQNI